MTNKKSDGEENYTWGQGLLIFFWVVMAFIGLCNFIPWVFSGVFDGNENPSVSDYTDTDNLRDGIKGCVDDVSYKWASINTDGGTLHYRQTVHATSTLESIKDCLSNL